MRCPDGGWAVQEDVTAGLTHLVCGGLAVQRVVAVHQVYLHAEGGRVVGQRSPRPVRDGLARTPDPHSQLAGLEQVRHRAAQLPGRGLGYEAGQDAGHHDGAEAATPLEINVQAPARHPLPDCVRLLALHGEIWWVVFYAFESKARLGVGLGQKILVRDWDWDWEIEQ